MFSRINLICRRKINRLERNYAFIRQSWELYELGGLDKEGYTETKIEYLEDESWEDEFNQLEGKEAKQYISYAYDYLVMLYRDYRAITGEEFRRYSQRILQKVI